jgi:hypothetical protein
MTEDVSRGLALLADDATPAPIDSHDVITRARTRTRRSRSMAAVFAAVVAIGASAVTIQADQWTEDAAVQRQEDPARRLTAQLAAALPEVIPARWEAVPSSDPTDPPRNIFRCTGGDRPIGSYQDLCMAMSWYRDAEGEFTLWTTVSNMAWSYKPGTDVKVDDWTLPDGTRVWTYLDTAGVGSTGYSQFLNALRPDGTLLELGLTWSNNNVRPGPLTVDELTKFADKFDY